MGKVKSGRKKVIRCRGAGLLTSLVGKAAYAVGKEATSLAGKVAGKALNTVVDLLPIEVHVPGYSYCGPGTNLKKRLKRGDPGINKLDAACKDHDIAYSKYSDTSRRAEADRVLADRAWERVKASDSSIGERATAWAVTNIMKTKAKFGGGHARRRGRGKKKVSSATAAALKRLKSMVGQGLYLTPYTGSGKKKRHQRRRTR